MAEDFENITIHLRFVVEVNRITALRRHCYRKQLRILPRQKFIYYVKNRSSYYFDGEVKLQIAALSGF